MNGLENWIQWHSLDERLVLNILSEILNILSEMCPSFSDNCVMASDVSEQSCVHCVLWLEENKHIVGV